MTTEERKAIYGKKVIFLTQNKYLINTIKTRLITMEYEIYILTDHKIIKNILSEYPDTILFITPDFKLNLTGWKNFIKALNNDIEFKDVQVGILTDSMSCNEATMFKGGLRLDAGFEHINEDVEETFRYIVKMLDALDAKGMRQYVRASCLSDSTSEAYWLEGDRMQKFNIIDISSVGLALEIPAKYFTSVQNVKTITNAKLVLKTKQVPITLNVYTVKPAGNHYILVAMFPMEIKKEVLSTIRTYVSERLLENLLEQIEKRPIDTIDYNNTVVETNEMI